ncbi:hypothetical protein ABZZ20_00795 [Streptomyces sp. NPDC006430]|uniref:three-helix bundle dimerization domain-containing protein n=1 Tax=Streptomyces sp. NPDC006430 TaxID=3154299 RepID=UPI0033BB0D47
MTVEEQAPQVGARLPVEGLGHRSGPVERADPVGPPNRPPLDSQDELVSIRNTVARLRAAYPSVDAATVEATVRTAYESFHRARVRAYVPILVERRSRKTLSAVCRTAAGQAVADVEDGPEPDATPSNGPRSGAEPAVIDLAAETPAHPGPEKDSVKDS